MGTEEERAHGTLTEIQMIQWNCTQKCKGGSS